MTSWLDGFAKLHSFKMSGGNILFSGKMLEPPNYLASVEAGELVELVGEAARCPPWSPSTTTTQPSGG